MKIQIWIWRMHIFYLLRKKFKTLWLHDEAEIFSNFKTSVKLKKWTNNLLKIRDKAVLSRFQRHVWFWWFKYNKWPTSSMPVSNATDSLLKRARINIIKCVDTNCNIPWPPMTNLTFNITCHLLVTLAFFHLLHPFLFHAKKTEV